MTRELHCHEFLNACSCCLQPMKRVPRLKRREPSMPPTPARKRRPSQQSPPMAAQPFERSQGPAHDHASLMQDPRANFPQAAHGHHPSTAPHAMIARPQQHYQPAHGQDTATIRSSDDIARAPHQTSRPQLQVQVQQQRGQSGRFSAAVPSRAMSQGMLQNTEPRHQPAFPPQSSAIFDGRDLNHHQMPMKYGGIHSQNDRGGAAAHGIGQNMHPMQQMPFRHGGSMHTGHTADGSWSSPSRGAWHRPNPSEWQQPQSSVIDRAWLPGDGHDSSSRARVMVHPQNSPQSHALAAYPGQQVHSFSAGQDQAGNVQHHPGFGQSGQQTTRLQPRMTYSVSDTHHESFQVPDTGNIDALPEISGTPNCSRDGILDSVIREAQESAFKPSPVFRPEEHQAQLVQVPLSTFPGPPGARHNTLSSVDCLLCGQH